MMGVGEGGGQKDYCGSEILAKRDFFGSMKSANILFGVTKKQGCFGVSAQISTILLLVWDFFRSRQILKFGFFGYKI